MKSMTLLVKVLLAPIVTACALTSTYLSPLLGADTPGACAMEDRNFSSEEGGCLQFSTGNVFSLARSVRTGYADARTYCENLVEGGFSDWDLPSRAALVSVSGLDLARTHLPFRVNDFFWSSTGNIDSAFIVELMHGDASSIATAGATAGVACIRHPVDTDGDGVPNSSDLCPRTPADAPRVSVAMSGHRKGCAPAEVITLSSGSASPGEFPDLATCPNVPPTVAALNLEFSPAFVRQYTQAAPALARQSLCVGVVNGLRILIDANEKLVSFLRGDTTGAPVLITIDRRDADVSFDASNFVLSLPSAMDAHTRALVMQTLEAPGGPWYCPGRTIDGSCWLLGEVNQTCDQVCSAVGRQYDVLTATYAGAAGTDQRCARIGAEFGRNFIRQAGWCDGGCIVHRDDGNVYRCYAIPTTSAGAGSWWSRFCACR